MLNFNIGDEASITKKITEEDIKSFADISGDVNPLHLDQEFAEKTQFGSKIAHGFMLVSYFSALFGTRLPGPGCVYLSQKVKFLKPVYVNDTVTAKVKLIKFNPKSGRLTFKTTCTVLNTEVITGESEIYMPPSKIKDSK